MKNVIILMDLPIKTQMENFLNAHQGCFSDSLLSSGKRFQVDPVALSIRYSYNGEIWTASINSSDATRIIAHTLKQEGR